MFGWSHTLIGGKIQSSHEFNSEVLNSHRMGRSLCSFLPLKINFHVNQRDRAVRFKMVVFFHPCWFYLQTFVAVFHRVWVSCSTFIPRAVLILGNTPLTQTDDRRKRVRRLEEWVFALVRERGMTLVPGWCQRSQRCFYWMPAVYRAVCLLFIELLSESKHQSQEGETEGETRGKIESAFPHMKAGAAFFGVGSACWEFEQIRCPSTVPCKPQAS